MIGHVDFGPQRDILSHRYACLRAQVFSWAENPASLGVIR
jgi:hypothetical protein